MKTLWIMDQEWILAWILDSVCIVVQTWGLKQGLDHSSFVSFGLFVNVSSKFCFFTRGSFVLSCEVVFEWSAVFFVIEHFTFFTICVILTNAFTFTSFPLNFYLSFFCCCGYGAGLIKTIDRSTDLGKKTYISCFMYPLHSLLLQPSAKKCHWVTLVSWRRLQQQPSLLL